MESMRRLGSSRKRSNDTLAVDLEALQELSRSDLKQRWEALYGTPPPVRASRQLLLRAVAYRMQEQVLGGLDAVTRRRLVRVVEDLAAGRLPTTPKGRIKPGTRLLREWQGVVHEVIVLERSVQYCGKEWPSLSAVAREITGARWSGPRFFGLKENGSGRG